MVGFGSSNEAMTLSAGKMEHSVREDTNRIVQDFHVTLLLHSRTGTGIFQQSNLLRAERIFGCPDHIWRLQTRRHSGHLCEMENEQERKGSRDLCVPGEI